MSYGHRPRQAQFRNPSPRKASVHTMNTSLTPTSAAGAHRRWSRWLAAAAASVLVAACGGGGSDTGSATGSGLTVGTVTGFGSIIVDGLRYDDRNVSISVDSESGAPDATTSVEVKLGQHVELSFTGGESDSSARLVKVSAAIVGKVSATAPDLVVAGQTVKVNTDPAAGPVTVFEGYTSAADIAVGDRVEVHGTPTAAHTVQATRIERKPSADTWVRVAGDISGLAADGNSFQLGGLTVNVANTTRLIPARAVLADGLRVVVWSDAAAVNNTVTAKLIRVKWRQGEDRSDARISGAITDCTATCDASFKVGGITVDASGAEFVNGSKADLVNGRWVALRGTLDTTTNTLVATRVVFHRIVVPHEEVKLRGAVTDFVDMANFKVRGVPVTTDTSTRFGASCTLPLANGTLVALSGSVDGFTVLAKAVECFTAIDGVVLEGKGKVLSVDSATKTFTLDGTLFAGLTLAYNDTTRFPSGKTAADIAVGGTVRVNGVVSGTVLTVTRVRFEDEMAHPAPGVLLLETEGSASNVVFSNGVLAGLTVNGLDFTATAATIVSTQDGPLADGANVRVVFRKTDTGNLALFVRTDR
jgi:Domain of unknown function (DUF5666)